jgi:hypothetical protein
MERHSQPIEVALRYAGAGRKCCRDPRAGLGHRQFGLRDAGRRDIGETLKWRLQCRAQLDIDATGEFTFDSPRHYTAIITSKGKMAGAVISDVRTDIQAKRVGDCTQ